MKSKKIIAFFLCVLLIFSVFTGCRNNSAQTLNDTSETATSRLDIASMFTNSDKEIGYDESESILITLADNASKSSGDNVKIDGNTITITDEGTYILSGKLSNGQIIVNAEKTDKLQVVLNGVNINSNTSSPFYIKQADKVFITLAPETENTLSNSGEFLQIDENSIDGVIFSKDDLTLNGKGNLMLNTDFGNGIVSKNDLVITSGTYKITTAKKGLEGKDSIRIADGTFEINSKKDAIHSENTDDTSKGFIYIANGSFNINCDTDAIDANNEVYIDGGNFNIITGEGSEKSEKLKKADTPPNFKKDFQPPNRNGQQQLNSQNNSQSTKTQQKEKQSGQIQQTTTEGTISSKAVKAGGNLTINAGNFEINSLDDSIHSNTNTYINGGTFNIKCGDDGIHANLKTIINGGNINISTSYEGVEGEIVEINGGEISITSTDDGINAASSNEKITFDNKNTNANLENKNNQYIKITGGKITVNANGDGVDSNGDIYVSGGETYVYGPTSNGNASLDYDGNAQITGGTFVAIGSSGMAQNFGTNSAQGSILLNTQSVQKGTVTLKDNSGNEMLTLSPTKEFSSVVISSPEIKTGKSYTLICGSETKTIEMTDVIFGNGHLMGGGFGKGNRGDKISPNDGTTPPQPPENGDRPMPPDLNQNQSTNNNH